jgi:DNA-binding NtrC family response regulator
VKRQRVLVVDDDQIVREELVRHLREKEGVIGVGAAGLDAALAVVGRVEVDLIVLDLLLADDGATRLLAEIAGRPGSGSCAILGMRARGLPSAADATALGCSDSIDKPFLLEDFSAAVLALLPPRVAAR